MSFGFHVAVFVIFLIVWLGFSVGFIAVIRKNRLFARTKPPEKKDYLNDVISGKIGVEQNARSGMGPIFSSIIESLCMFIYLTSPPTAALHLPYVSLVLGSMVGYFPVDFLFVVHWGIVCAAVMILVAMVAKRAFDHRTVWSGSEETVMAGAMIVVHVMLGSIVCAPQIVIPSLGVLLPSISASPSPAGASTEEGMVFEPYVHCLSSTHLSYALVSTVLLLLFIPLSFSFVIHRCTTQPRVYPFPRYEATTAIFRPLIAGLGVLLHSSPTVLTCVILFFSALFLLSNYTLQPFGDSSRTANDVRSGLLGAVVAAAAISLWASLPAPLSLIFPVFFAMVAMPSAAVWMALKNTDEQQRRSYGTVSKLLANLTKSGADEGLRAHACDALARLGIQDDPDFVHSFVTAGGVETVFNCLSPDVSKPVRVRTLVLLIVLAEKPRLRKAMCTPEYCNAIVDLIRDVVDHQGGGFLGPAANPNIAAFARLGPDASDPNDAGNVITIGGTGIAGSDQMLLLGVLTLTAIMRQADSYTAGFITKYADTILPVVRDVLAHCYSLQLSGSAATSARSDRRAPQTSKMPRQGSTPTLGPSSPMRRSKSTAGMMGNPSSGGVGSGMAAGGAGAGNGGLGSSNNSVESNHNSNAVSSTHMVPPPGSPLRTSAGSVFGGAGGGLSTPKVLQMDSGVGHVPGDFLNFSLDESHQSGLLDDDDDGDARGYGGEGAGGGGLGAGLSDASTLHFTGYISPLDHARRNLVHHTLNLLIILCSNNRTIKSYSRQYHILYLVGFILMHATEPGIQGDAANAVSILCGTKNYGVPRNRRIFVKKYNIVPTLMHLLDSKNANLLGQTVNAINNLGENSPKNQRLLRECSIVEKYETLTNRWQDKDRTLYLKLLFGLNIFKLRLKREPSATMKHGLDDELRASLNDDPGSQFALAVNSSADHGGVDISAVDPSGAGDDDDYSTDEESGPGLAPGTPGSRFHGILGAPGTPERSHRRTGSEVVTGSPLLVPSLPRPVMSRSGSLTSAELPVVRSLSSSLHTNTTTNTTSNTSAAMNNNNNRRRGLGSSNELNRLLLGSDLESGSEA